MNEATGEVSDSPYPSSTWTPNASSIPCSTSIGSDAPPDAQTRRLEVSNRSLSGTDSSPMYMVGTPRKTFTLSASQIRSACSGSNLGSRVMHAPEYIAQFIAQVCPNEWNSGSPPNRTSPGPLGISVSTEVITLVRRFSWLSSAPLGLPVVPEV